MIGGRPVNGWPLDLAIATVPVRESFEPLVAIASVGRVVVHPAYHEMGYATAAATLSAREGAWTAIISAAEALPPGLSLLVWDGLRTLETQEEIADRFESALNGRDISLGAPHRPVEQYVTPVPRWEEDFRSSPPPHSTGGAFDVSLCDSDGAPCDLGAGFDEFNERAWTRHFERSGLNAADRARRDLRRTLYWAMIGAGFAPYPWEYWHWEYGTQRAAAFFGRAAAQYGPAVPWIERKQP